MKKGHRREYQVRDAFRADGWYAFRTRDDQSVCDIVAMRPFGVSPDDPPAVFAWLQTPPVAEVRMVEVKCNKLGGPYLNFRPDDRDALKAAAARAGATAVLCYWPIGGERVDIEAEDWPERRAQAAREAA